VRTADYRYTEWDDGKQGEEFYSLADDPQGLKNRADDPAIADERSELRELLHLMCASPGESNSLLSLFKCRDKDSLFDWY